MTAFPYCFAARTRVMPGSSLVAVKFEVYGKVQRVFFRKYTEAKGRELGLRGWCENTSTGTVQGEVEGPLDKVKEMKAWLQTTGSPKSRIDRAEFGQTEVITEHRYEAFGIRR